MNLWISIIHLVCQFDKLNWLNIKKKMVYMSNLVIQLFSFIVQICLLIFLAVLRIKLSLWPMVSLHSCEPLGVVTTDKGR